MSKPFAFLLAASLFLPLAGVANAQEGQHFYSGKWYLTLGGTGFVGPKFEGGKKNSLQFAPVISLGKQGGEARFSSRNDSPAFALIDQGPIRAGIAGKLVMPRDADDDHALRGMRDVKLGLELGGFAEVYPTDWLRVRGEVRQGIRSHSGVVGDLSADAFMDMTPDIRLSGGPRVSFASAGYFDRYYGVSAARAASGGPSAYNPGSGIHSAGVGAAITWKATENISATSFVEYRRLLGPAADSSLVRERGSANQLTVGVSASYRFNFTLE